MNLNRYLVTFNENNKPIVSVGQYWNESNWINNTQRIFEYNNNDNLIFLLDQNWNENGWDDYFQMSLEYDENNNVIHYLRKRWQVNEWVNISQNFLEYDMNNNEIFRMYQTWDDISWANVSQYFFDYNINNNKVFEVAQNWEDTNWTNDFRTFYYYGKISNTSNLNTSDGVIQIFPNPNTGSFTIDLSENDIPASVLNVYDAMGRLIYTKTISKGTNQQAIHFNDFSQGLYFLQVISDNQQTSQNIIVKY